MSLKQKLNSMYSQQRRVTGAKHATTDPRLKRTLELKQKMLGRRIGRYQAEEKSGIKK